LLAIWRALTSYKKYISSKLVRIYSDDEAVELFLIEIAQFVVNLPSMQSQTASRIAEHHEYFSCSKNLKDKSDWLTHVFFQM
jgi:hypothetical protein